MVISGGLLDIPRPPRRANGPPLVVGPPARMSIMAPLKVGPPARMAITAPLNVGPPPRNANMARAIRPGGGGAGYVRVLHFVPYMLLLRLFFRAIAACGCDDVIGSASFGNLSSRRGSSSSTTHGTMG